MATLVYIDETGSAGKGAKSQPLLTVVAALVDERHVRALQVELAEMAQFHLRHVRSRPSNLELHGYDIWNGRGFWKNKDQAELIAIYEQAISVVDKLNIHFAWASINKDLLAKRYGDNSDAYLLALQFMLEKIDAADRGRKILVADEAKEHQLRAIKMVADMQDWGSGVVPGRPLKTVIDSLHFVRSDASPGVQLADLVAYALQRKWNRYDRHPKSKAAIARIVQKICDHTMTWREPWPS